MIDYEKKARNLKRRYNQLIIRKLSDMKKHYQEQNEVKKILKQGKDPLIYTVFRKDLDDKKNLSLTLMKPGKIGNEFFMTKGHKHDKPHKELYVLVKGQGKLILQDIDDNVKVINLKKNKEIRIPGDSAHRLVNTGKETLEVITIDFKDVGKDYSTEFKKRILDN